MSVLTVCELSLVFKLLTVYYIYHTYFVGKVSCTCMVECDLSCPVRNSSIL